MNQATISFSRLLTLKAVGVEKIFAFFVALDTTLCTPDPLIKKMLRSCHWNVATNLSGDPPEEPLALVAIGGTCGRPEDEVVRCSGGDWVNQGLQRLFIHMELLKMRNGDYT